MHDDSPPSLASSLVQQFTSLCEPDSLDLMAAIRFCSDIRVMLDGELRLRQFSKRCQLILNCCDDEEAQARSEKDKNLELDAVCKENALEAKDKTQEALTEHYQHMINPALAASRLEEARVTYKHRREEQRNAWGLKEFIKARHIMYEKEEIKAKQWKEVVRARVHSRQRQQEERYQITTRRLEQWVCEPGQHRLKHACKTFLNELVELSKSRQES